MSDKLTESAIENLAIELLANQGYQYLHGADLAPDAPNPGRPSFGDEFLVGRLQDAVARLNPTIPPDAQEQAIKEILRLAVETGSTRELLAANEAFHRLLTNGVEVEFQHEGRTKGDKVWLVDFANPAANDCLVVNQFTVTTKSGHGHVNKRPDLVLFINGLPLVVVELKNAASENATVRSAYEQLQTYKHAIPSLFLANGLLVASDGLEARMGSLSAGFSRFMAWKTTDGKKEASHRVGQLETLIQDVLKPATLLELIRHFTVFEKSRREDPKTGLTTVETVKKTAAYHQFYAVKKAVESTLHATGTDGSRKGGVVWHTQGSGKSLSMVFYAGKLVLALDNPTIVVLTDRNDLDDQLFDTFAASRQLLRQEPVQAENRDDLRDKLKVASGGVIFTTMQKFSPKNGEAIYPLLSDRRNIVVIADEAHRSQYGFKAKEVDIKDADDNIVGKKTAYGFAKYLRDALPNATFIGFTGTPVELDDKNTPAVFGDYVDVYDIAQAVEDGATVRIYYESRLAKVRLKEKEKEALDQRFDQVMEDAADYETGFSDEDELSEKAKAKWTQLEAIVGNRQRVENVARDLVAHFEERQKIFDGKGLIIAMSRRICVELYDAIVTLRLGWHSDDDAQGAIKVIMTGSSADPQAMQPHIRSKEARKAIGERLKDPGDPLKLVIVRDMWLTGFDAPCLHTLYVDKPMKGHNLMQAIARVNRVYKDKPGGLVVDYIGIASDLKRVLAIYTESGGKGQPTLDIDDAVRAMQEKFEVVQQMLAGFDYRRYFGANTSGKLTIILEAEEYVLALEDGKARFSKEVDLLAKAFALSVPDERAMAIKDELAFFQAVKARLAKFERGEGKSKEELDSAIRQLVDEAVVSDQVVDIFDAAGIKKPDISILSDEFMAEIKGMQHRNLALELLRKILNDEIRVRSKKNLVQSRALSEMLESAIKRYQNNLLSAAGIIEELIELAREIKEADRRGEKLGLTEDELAFYDALEVNDSAVQVLGDNQLREIARKLVEKVKQNATIDWTVKESVRSKLKVIVKRILRKYGYPPDKQATATETILKQAELLAESWAV
ncbi:type I site-specific deoxyribonuclease, HsdR family [Nitrosococcus halophilus Nc 4]|uniref:Type I restriction enzyme endonuclease subunit n=1 Tax=Nitrosococcus halophilus (strain Nc4) TaxID=472759 RepID=D5BY84_NITHN|nr:type I restriction endonuclease subunit R [Nitrosococcus halophilus]ADE14067.1 type I site-specific deoxyribonuclease, HsdR family [Nitrosococcus halophilus Nc 4]